MSLGSASRSCQKEKLTFKSTNLSSVSKYGYTKETLSHIHTFPFGIILDLS